MNFLAHLTLSNNDDDILIGNFIADTTRRVEYPKFKKQVVYGIELHHKIDDFTDAHPIVEESKDRLRSRHGKYAGVIVDIFYDHFLAKNYAQYGEYPLEEFAQRCYLLFERRFSELTQGTQRMLPYMKRGNWLVNYGTEEGMRNVFKGMGRRASFSNKMALAVEDLLKFYPNFKSEFEAFYPQLADYVTQEIRELPYP
jgi:acyl carrier protein phosphodiesterase